MEANVKTPTHRKPINLSLNAELVRMGKDLGLNISRIAEEALAQAIKKSVAESWAKENEEAIKAYNARVAKKGVFSDGMRTF